MISKVKHYLSSAELLSFYHATFASNMLYGSQIWGITTLGIVNKIKILQNSVIRLISQEYNEILNSILRNREEFNENPPVDTEDTDDEDAVIDEMEFEVIHVTPFYHSLKLLKLEDNITLKNCLFVHDFLNNKLPDSFDKYFTLHSSMSTTATRQSNRGSLFMPNVTTVKYGNKSVKHQSILAWNQIIQLFPDQDLLKMSKTKLKYLIKNHFIESYSAQQTQINDR